MQVVLRTISNSPSSRQSVIRQGRVLRVGRTSWADMSIPEDPALADVHFSLECGPARCILRSLTAESPTLLDGAEVTEADVPDGARITAGNTEFTVVLEGFVYGDTSQAQTEEEAEEQEPVTSGYRYVEVPLAADVAQKCELEPEALELLEQGMTVRQYVERLAESGQAAAAIAFLAAALPKREAVWWGFEACGGDTDTIPVDQRLALEAAGRWVNDPSEENRRGTETAATAGGLTTAATCVAMAAFFSGGSLAPPDIDTVPPPDYLTAHTIACALKLIAYSGDAAKVDETQQRFLGLGIEVADGQSRWDE